MLWSVEATRRIPSKHQPTTHCFGRDLGVLPSLLLNARQHRRRSSRRISTNSVSYRCRDVHACQRRVVKLAPTLLSVFASRLSRSRPQSPQPGSPSSSPQGLPMGQQQSKKSKKNNKDKDKDAGTESTTPPDSVDTDNTPQSSLSRATAPHHSLGSNTLADGSSSIQVNVTDPDGGVISSNGNGLQPPVPNGSPSSSSSISHNPSSADQTGASISPLSSPLIGNGTKPAPLDIPLTQTILSNATSPSGLPTPGSTNSFSVGDPSYTGNGVLKDKSKVVQVEIDDMIQRLLDVGYTGKVSKSLCLKNTEITAICLAAREVLLNQPTLI